jgi:hypothetical protein
VIVTSYNQHVRLLSPEPWLVGTSYVFSGLGADFVYGIISLIDSEKGERKEHACAKACLQHLGTPRKMQA